MGRVLHDSATTTEGSVERYNIVRFTGALLDRLTHHVHILTMNGDSYRFKQSAGRRCASATIDVTEQHPATTETDDQADAAPIGPATI